MNDRRESPTAASVSSNARQHAWETLERADAAGEFVTDLLERSANVLAAVDRPLVWELTHGVQRKRLTLDRVISTFCSQARERVEVGLWQLLRVGCYQLMYLDRVPPHAAVHETVELARQTGHPQWCRFANGILRAVGRSLTDRVSQESSETAYPTGAGTFREFDRPVFPDPKTDPVGHQSVIWNVPTVLLNRWRAQFDESTLREMLGAIDRPQLPCLRVNPLRTDRETVLAQLQEQGIAAERGELPEAIVLRERVAPSELTGLSAGWFSIQDQTTMHASVWLEPQPGETILDLCAAPGTKTGHLAERMENQGTIVATDVSESRMESIHDNCRRLGITIVTTELIRRDGSGLPDGPFDAILIDAPCTNTGVLGKRVEVRWRFRPEDVEELALTQQRLLQVSADRLKPGGRLLYSTCSLEREENCRNVENFLGSRPEFTLDRDRQFLPGEPTDGGYLALLRRHP